MDGICGPQLVCRACLRIVENKTQSFGFIEDSNGNLKDMLMCCVPEMDIYVSSNPIICFPCIQLLVTVYNFKTRCLNTETIIRSYVQRNNLTDFNHVSLHCVVQELIKLNHYFQEVQHRRAEAAQHNMEGVSQNANGLPKIPFPEEHFRLLEKEEQAKNQAMDMEQEAVLSDQLMYHDTMHCSREDVNRNRTIMENRFILGHQNVQEDQGVLQDLPISPVVVANHDTLSSPQVMAIDGAAANQSIEGHEVSEKETVQSNISGAEKPALQDAQNIEENHHSKVTINRTSEEFNEVDEGFPPVTTETDTKQVKESASIHNNSRNNAPSKCETEKEDARPRLIIKICKNKITIPSFKNNDFNEKEDKEIKEMDVESNKTEMPPAEENAFAAYQPSDIMGQELYQCPNCTFVTTHNNFYVAHLNDCGSEQNEKKCPHCPHVTNRQYALNKHINTMHTKSVWYMCDFCPYRSTDSSCLRRHKRNVHPEKLQNDLVCQLCRYRCTTEYHLKKHMMKHKDNMALQCEFCSYSTRDRSNFRKHVFIHNPKPKNCEFCDYKCVSPYQMKLHLKRLHHGVGMEDVDCRSEVSINEVVRDIGAAIKEMKAGGEEKNAE